MIPRQAEDMIEKALAPMREKIDDLERRLKEVERTPESRRRSLARSNA